MKLGVALLLARLAWRFVRARTAARGGRRLLAAHGQRPRPLPRVRVELSPRLWLAAFVVTSGLYLVQQDAERAAVGRWPLFAPWLHSSALPVFAVLAVLVAVAWGAVSRWLRDYERYAQDTCARASRLSTPRRSRRALTAPSAWLSRRAGSSASRSRAGLLRSPPSPRYPSHARGLGVGIRVHPLGRWR